MSSLAMTSQSLLTTTILSASLLLAACQPQSAEDSNKDSKKHVNIASSNTAIAMQPAVKQQASINAEFMQKIAGDQWVTVSEETGLRLLDSQQKIIDAIDLAFEYFDHRVIEVNGKQQTVIATLDAKNNRPALITIENGAITEQRFAQPLLYALEGMCMYQPKGGAFQLFLLDEDHLAHQVLVSGKEPNLALTEIRTVTLPAGVENCVVDDATQALYFTEENIGLWKVDARSESASNRTVIDMVKPYGQLNNVGPMTLVNNQIVMAEDEANQVYTINLENQNTQLFSLPETAAVKTMASESLAESAQMTFLNDSDGKLYQFDLAIPKVAAQDNSIVNIAPDAETTPVKQSGDAADDPAIWINHANKEHSKILGTNKKYGLYVYDLQGQEVQELIVGRVNNVDVRQGFTYQGQAMDIAAASQRDRNAIALFKINPTTGLVEVAEEIETSLSDIYGLCMYASQTEKGDKAIYVYANDADGRYQQYQVMDGADGWQGKLVREFAVATQPEGCTVDEKTQRLFVGEENEGIWVLGAEPTDSTDMTVVAKLNDKLHADVEGIELYQTETQNILVVSSQGNDSYVLLNADAPYDYIGRFRIGLNAEKGIDGASETDGLTVTPLALSKQYPQGILVVQDGRNLMPADKQNFKIVSWEEVAQAIDL